MSPKSLQKSTGEGVFFKERMYAHELFKIGAFTMFLHFLFCFSISLFLISLSGRFSSLPDHETRFSSPQHGKTDHMPDFDCLVVYAFKCFFFISEIKARQLFRLPNRVFAGKESWPGDANATYFDNRLIAYFNCIEAVLLQKPFHCCKKWILMQSALGMVAGEIAVKQLNVSR